MKVSHELKHWQKTRRPLCLAIGFFDGVHRGHARVIRETIRRARACGGEAWALTFDPHPARVLHPATAPRLLTALPHKLRWLASLGLDGCLVLPFTRQLSQRPPQNFLEHLLGSAPTLTHVLVGPNWRFGKNRAGTTATLSRFARTHGFHATSVPPARHGGQPISSTRIRNAIAAGDLTAATAMLGRPFSILGPVVRGARIGHTLGYPTANVPPASEVLPPYGIYAARALIGQAVHDGVVSYGVRPTIDKTPGAPALIELHLFDFNANLYGHEIEIFFVRRLRDERTFASLNALRGQIARDVVASRRILAMRKKLKEFPLHYAQARIIVRPNNTKEQKTTQGKARR